MSKLGGKWELIPERTENYDGFAKASGIPSDLVEKYRNDVQTVEYIINGNSWKIGYYSPITGNTQWCNGEFGKEVAGKDEETGDYKLIITKVSENSLVEVTRSGMMDWKPMTLTRTVEPNGELKTVAELKDDQSGKVEIATQYFKRI